MAAGKKEGAMDKQSFVLEIVKHFICDKITKGVGAQSTLCDDQFCNEIKMISCKACKVYDRVTSHVRVHEKSPDGECHLM